MDSSSSTNRVLGLSLSMSESRDKRIHLHVRVPYATRWGQSLVLCGAGALLGNWSVSKGHPMRCHHEKDGLIWEASLLLPWQPQVRYKLALVKSENGETKVDKWESAEHVLALPDGLSGGDVVTVQETWQDRGHPEAILTSAAFTKVLRVTRPPVRGHVRLERAEVAVGEAIVRFRIQDALTEPGATMFVSGSLPQLGNWQQDTMMQLTEVEGLWYEGELRVPYAQFPFTYKYALRSPDGGVVVEVGEPRVAAIPQVPSASSSSSSGNSGSSSAHSAASPVALVLSDGSFRRDKLWRGAGVALPVFSVRTHKSVGAGEFMDLIPLIDWADSVGLRLIQLLPVNDTSVYDMWWDSYPYSTLSVFALHPLYLALRALRPEGGFAPELQEELDAMRRQLDSRQVDYEATMRFKKTFARKVFDAHGAETTRSQDFKQWLREQTVWLKPFAAFCFLKDIFQTAEHWRWGALASPTPELIERLTSPASDHFASIQFTYFLQYHLHKQMSAVSAHAAARRVVLKGDLPIGVDKRSVDTWMDPQLFRMDKSTGAPPDVFDPNGQNWGFPTYNWEEMAKDDYAWWQRRLKHMARYFQAYRIDHILGFFRIWEIPGDCVTGLMGHFRPSHALSTHELKARGVYDVERLCEPFIRTHHLAELFGKAMAQEVAARYLIETSEGCYKFRPQYATERQIAEIKVREDSPAWLLEETELTRKGLMKLRQNVVLLRDPEDKDKFYPRFALSTTSSFKDLEPSWRDALSQMHDDYFYRRQEALWRESALQKLPVLMGATDMLVCGEDLGFVPACVPPVMEELGLVGLRIQRMATESGREFNNPANYPYLSVASPSCHDVLPMRAWYEADADRRERFFYNVLNGGGAPPEACTPEVMRAVVLQHLQCPSVLTIFPIQDLLALSSRYTSRPAAEEIINDPTNSKHYWRFRLHVCVEDLLRDGALGACMQEMLLISGRATPRDFAADS